VIYWVLTWYLAFPDGTQVAIPDTGSPYFASKEECTSYAERVSQHLETRGISYRCLRAVWV
jgi:hypothetical protein